MTRDDKIREAAKAIALAAGWTADGFDPETQMVQPIVAMAQAAAKVLEEAE